jgi:hypothetical protein
MTSEIVPFKEPRARAGLATKLPAVAVRSNTDAEKVRRRTSEVLPSLLCYMGFERVQHLAP